MLVQGNEKGASAVMGLGIAAKRYTLFQTVFDLKGKFADIKIVNPRPTVSASCIRQRTTQRAGGRTRRCGSLRCGTTSCADSWD
jgi:hypothetical protein